MGYGFVASIVIIAVLKLWLAQWYGFLRPSFARQAFFEHILLPANFLGGTFVPAT